MVNKTDNYALNKPTPDEFYDIEHFNENADAIDSALKELDNKVGNLPIPDISGAISTHNMSNSAHDDIRTLAQTAQTTADTAQTVANEAKSEAATKASLDSPAFTGTPTLNGKPLILSNKSARISLSSYLTLPSGGETVVPFDTVDINDGYEIDLLNSPSRITIPSGLKKVLVVTSVTQNSGASAPGVFGSRILKNGVPISQFSANGMSGGSSIASFSGITISDIIEVSEGDYIQLSRARLQAGYIQFTIMNGIAHIHDGAFLAVIAIE